MTAWKSIIGYPNYQISDTGHINSIKSNKLLAGAINSSGYMYVNLVHDKIKKTTAIHKIVMEHFGIEKPNGNYVIDHKDRNKTNNSITNLEWVTVRENTLRYYNNQYKKHEIIDLYERNMSVKNIVEIVGLSAHTIYQTIHKHLAEKT